jgi:hypothetical protein
VVTLSVYRVSNVWDRVQGQTPCATVAVCQSISKRWPAALYEAGQSALMLMKGSKIPRFELSTVYFYQHCLLFMPNKLQYIWRRDYCECVRPVQLPILTEVQAPSLLEQYPRYIPYWVRAGYSITKKLQRMGKIIRCFPSFIQASWELWDASVSCRQIYQVGGGTYVHTFFFHIRTLHLEIIKVFYSPTNAQVIVLKTILEFTLTL